MNAGINQVLAPVVCTLECQECRLQHNFLIVLNVGTNVDLKMSLVVGPNATYFTCANNFMHSSV